MIRGVVGASVRQNGAGRQIAFRQRGGVGGQQAARVGGQHAACVGGQHVVRVGQGDRC